METDDRTLAEKVSDSVASFGGSWRFIITGFFIILFWVIVNLLPFFIGIRWDGYPFILLNLFLSLIAAFQAPFILMAQKRCEVKQDLIYRSLFKEIKELVETNLGLEHEIIERNKKLEKELEEIKKQFEMLKKEIVKNDEKPFTEGNVYEV